MAFAYSAVYGSRSGSSSSSKCVARRSNSSDGSPSTAWLDPPRVECASLDCALLTMRRLCCQETLFSRSNNNNNDTHVLCYGKRPRTVTPLPLCSSTLHGIAASAPARAAPTRPNSFVAACRKIRFPLSPSSSSRTTTTRRRRRRRGSPSKVGQRRVVGVRCRLGKVSPGAGRSVCPHGKGPGPARSNGEAMGGIAPHSLEGRGMDLTATSTTPTTTTSKGGDGGEWSSITCILLFSFQALTFLECICGPFFRRILAPDLEEVVEGGSSESGTAEVDSSVRKPKNSGARTIRTSGQEINNKKKK